VKEFPAVQTGTINRPENRMTTAKRVCAECGATVFADAPQGVCSACLFRTGLASLDNENDEVFEPTIARMLKDFGDYELLEEIGRGGQGVVYRARQKSLNRIVALKVIGLAHWATEAHVKRFRLEAEAAARLNHPCIVPIYEVGERDGACYFSMGLVAGGQLDAVAKREPMPIRHAAELTAKLARTVSYAHEHGILHRDIKPGNILLDAKGEPHLTDFGLARLVETESTVTRTMEVLGTPSYMAPEQAVGNNAAVSSLTDVYGLGAVLYQLLTGHPPFAGGTTYETIRLLLNTEPRQPRLWNRKIGRDLATICLKCLEKDPQRRYSSALALAEDLQCWLTHEPIRAKRSGFFTHGRKWVRRNPISALLAASLVALAAATGWIIWKSEFVRQPVTTGIAVLPFENLNKDDENAFFAEGVPDEIMTELAKIADLKVISRTSVMKYKNGLERNLREISKTLGVSHLVEGSVQRAGGRIRVSVQLIDARSDTHLWAEHYDRDFADVFAIQTEIAQQIADQLRVNLSPTERASIAEPPTADLIAYALYSEARALGWGKLGWGNWDGAEKTFARKLELLNEATQRDPNFALAHCALAQTQDDLYEQTGDRTHLELAKNAVDVALRLRPDLGETHLELARYYFYAREFDRAHDELAVARRTLPNDSQAIFMAARIDRRQNHWDESLANLQKASELDPRNTEINYHLKRQYRQMHLYGEFEQRFPQESDPEPAQNLWVKLERAELKLDEGDPVAAQALLAQVPLNFSPTMEVWDIRFMTALYLRDYDAANRVVGATPAKFVDDVLGGQPPESWADGLIARLRGDKQKAQAMFAAARKRVDATWGDKNKNEEYFALAARCDAGLERKQEAIAEARRAVDLIPIAKDSWLGPGFVTNLALVYAWTGERELAIEQLQIVAKIPAGPSYGDLRFNPCWDPLRGDPRFDKIVAAAKAASR
jgi:serine/threonine protein kinase/tetratricopeptide (TPR) repeat protein